MTNYKYNKNYIKEWGKQLILMWEKALSNPTCKKKAKTNDIHINKAQQEN